MFKSKSLLVLLLLMTSAAFAATASSDGKQASAVPIKTFLRADLSLKSVVLAPEVTQPAAAKVAGFSLKTCRCTCGQPCTTNADCSPGTACGVGITCCNRTPGKSGKNALNSVFQQRDELSSSRHPSMNAQVVNCKP